MKNNKSIWDACINEDKLQESMNLYEQLMKEYKQAFKQQKGIILSTKQVMELLEKIGEDKREEVFNLLEDDYSMMKFYFS